MPRAGTVETPRANIRNIRSVNRREVVRSCSSSTPEKNGRSSPLTTSGGMWARRHASAALTSGRSLSPSTGRVAHSPAYSPRAALPRRPPTGRPSAPAAPESFCAGLVIRCRSPLQQDLDGGVEGAQVEGVEVDRRPERRVAGVQHLEAAVERVAVDVVGADPAAHRVAGLQDRHVDAPVGQLAGARQPGQPGPDHDDVGGAGHGVSWWACRNSGGR